MQSRSHRKLAAVILGSDMGNQLYPLTKNNPKSNLAIGNKKLIAYQLEQLQTAQISTIIVTYSPDTIKVKQFLQSQFIPAHPSYPHSIQFCRLDNNLSEYSSLQKVLTSTLCNGFDQDQGIIIVPVDLVSSVKLNVVIEQHLQKHNDVTMLFKQKKEFAKDQKKPDYDFQPEADITLLNEQGQVYALRDIEIYDYSGFNLPVSVYSKINKASFQKTVDSRVYVFSQRILKIIKNLTSSEISFLKIDFIDTLVKNQSNSTLLDYIEEKCRKPLKIVAKVYGQNQYIRRINSAKIYENINLESLIRGPKQKQVLLANSYTQQIDEKAMQQYKGCLIGSGCQFEGGAKLTRSIIENGCKIGKGAQIANSTIMAGSVIEEGCKISNSVIGPNCLLKSQASIVACQLAMGCIVEKGSNNQKQILIPLQ